MGNAGRFMLVCVFAVASTVAIAADGIETRPLRFAKGASSATVKGTLKGDQTIDYKVGARAGQTMKVTLQSSNGSNYFNVLPPGSSDVAVFVGLAPPSSALTLRRERFGHTRLQLSFAARGVHAC